MRGRRRELDSSCTENAWSYGGKVQLNEKKEPFTTARTLMRVFDSRKKTCPLCERKHTKEMVFVVVVV